MKNIIFLYYVLCYTAGAAGLVAAIIYARARRDRRDARFAVFSASFALIVIPFTIFAYFDATSGLSNPVLLAVYILNLLGNCSLVYALPAFMDCLPPAAAPRWRRLWALLAGIAAACNVIGIVMAFNPTSIKTANAVITLLTNAQFAIMIAAIAYAVGRGIIVFREARKRGLRADDDEGWPGLEAAFTLASIVSFVPIVCVDFIPYLTVDRVFPEFFAYIRVFPLLYAFLNAVYLARVFRLLLRERPAERPAVLMDEGLLSGAGLSAREAEVARLLASGITYKEIAWRLKIKMGTVQSHVMGAYRKLGVSCKEDLMRKLRGEELGAGEATVPVTEEYEGEA